MRGQLVSVSQLALPSCVEAVVCADKRHPTVGRAEIEGRSSIESFRSRERAAKRQEAGYVAAAAMRGPVGWSEPRLGCCKCCCADGDRRAHFPSDQRNAFAGELWPDGHTLDAKFAMPRPALNRDEQGWRARQDSNHRPLALERTGSFCVAFLPYRRPAESVAGSLSYAGWPP